MSSELPSEFGRRGSETPRTKIDINCDLGEGEPAGRTRALMELVDSANIACGGHSGDEASMRCCLVLARELGVRAGAHPGCGADGAFGRGAIAAMTPDELTRLLDEQVGRLATVAGELGVELTHVKLHGALYHATDADPQLAAAYLEFVATRRPGMVVVARAGGRVARLAASSANRRPEVWEEGFLDRGYRDDGSLVPRGETGALLAAPGEVLARLEDLRDRGGLRGVSGTWIPLRPRTLCVHSDSPGAVEMLRAVRSVLRRAGPGPFESG